MFRKRPSKGHKKHVVEPESLPRPSRVIRLHYYESPEQDEQSSIHEGASISTANSIFNEEHTLPEEPLFHEPFLYTRPTFDLESYEEEEPAAAPAAGEEDEFYNYNYEDYEEEDEEDVETELAEEEESLVDDSEDQTSEDDEDEDDEEADEEEADERVYQALAVTQHRALLKEDWSYPVIKINDEMFEHYLDSEDIISTYSIHEPAVATVVPILGFSRPRLVDIPAVAGRKRKTQYDTPRQHSRNNSNSSDNSSQHSSNESTSHSDNESNGPWDSPASSVSATPTTTVPSSPSDAFPKRRSRARTNTYTRPMSGTFPKLDKLAERYNSDDTVSSSSSSMKPFRRSLTRITAPDRATSMVLPGYADHDDIDEILEKEDRAMRRREWQLSSSVWHR